MPPTAGELGRRATLDRVHAHACQLLETIEATLTVSRLEAGRLPIRTTAVDLDEFFVVLRAELPDAWIKPGVRLVWDVPARLPEIDTDGPKLKIVLRNLIHNACKFTDAGTVRLAVAVEEDRVGEAAGLLCLTVEDTGIGIPPDLQDAVFDMFRQADGSDTRRHGGVGLGLYIAKRFVEAQAGTIALASVPGAGSRFDVRMPLRRAVHELAARTA